MEKIRIIDMGSIVKDLVSIADGIEERMEIRFNEYDKGQVSAFRNVLQSIVLIDGMDEISLNNLIMGVTREVSNKLNYLAVGGHRQHPDFVSGEIGGYQATLGVLITIREKDKQLQQQQKKEASEWERILKSKGLK